MKLLFPTTGLLAAFAQASTTHTPFSAADVQQLQLAINQKLAHQNQIKSRVVRDLSNYINNFNFEKTECSMKVQGFWNQCRQCLVQQCEAFTEKICGNKPNDIIDDENEVLAEVVANYEKVLQDLMTQTGMKFELKVQNGLVLIASVPNNRKKRSIENSSCGQVSISCESGNCEGMQFPSNVEVTCQSSDANPLQDLSGYETTSDQQWNYKVDATYNFVISDEADANGNTVLKINFPAFESSNAEKIETDAPQNSIVDSFGLNDAKDYNTWSFDSDSSAPNDNINNDDSVYTNWNLDDIFDGDEQFLPSMTEVDSIMTAQELDDKLNEYCDQIGGCDDVQRRRRGLKFRALLNRKKKSAEFKRSKRDAAEACQELTKYPNNCVELNLPQAKCAPCSEKISAHCPKFDAARKDLSQKISEAATVISKYSNQNKVITSFNSLRDENDNPLVFIQRAQFNPSTNQVKLLMAVTDKKILVQGKLPNGMKLYQLSGALV